MGARDAKRIWPWKIGKTRITGIYGQKIGYMGYIYIIIYIHPISGLEKIVKISMKVGKETRYVS